MTDRVKGFTVTLEKDIRIDDVEEILSAVRMIRGVAHVEPSITTHNDHMNRQRIKGELLMKLFKVLHEDGEELSTLPIEKETPIVATFGWNDALKKPFELLYEFGYYTQYGCVVYKKGECNMQDSAAFKIEQIRVATPEDLKERVWG